MSPKKKEIEKEAEDTTEPEVKEKATEEIKELEDLPGIGPTTAEKLRESGFDTLMAVAAAPVSIIIEATGLTDQAAQKAVKAARSALKMGFITGVEVAEKRKEVKKISTGSKEVDKLIGGGVESQAIFEAFGEFGSGKTQLGLQLAVNVQLPEDKGGVNGTCIFIDTENTFRPERIRQLAEAKGLDPEKALKNILVARAYSSDHQILLIDKIDEVIKEKKLSVKLIVVDSLTALFRSEYAGRGTLADRQQKLNRHMHMLQRISDMHNLAIFVTNQVQARPDIFFGNPTAAIGGHIVGHASTYRVYLRKGKADKRIARLIDSPHLPEGEAVFKVTAKGVEEA